MLSQLSSVGISQTNKLKVSLDNVPAIEVFEGENIFTDNGSYIIKLKDSVVCHKRTDLPGANVKATITDPNGNGVATKLNSALTYNISSNEVNANVSDFSEVCVTEKGSTFGDLIFRNGFIPGLNYNVENSAVEPNDVVTYSINYANESGSAIYFDLKEFYSQNGSGNSYFESSPLSWNCSIVDLNGGNPTECSVEITLDQGNRILLNGTLDNDKALKIDVERRVDQNSQIGESLDLLVGLFIKSAKFSNFFTDVLYSHQTIDTINNEAPLINWGVNYPTIQFSEGSSEPRNDLTFFIHDTGGDISLDDLQNYIVSNDNRLEILNIRFDEINSLTDRVRFDMVPNPNDEHYFTTGAPEIVSVQVADSLGLFSNEIELAVNIQPVNDRPSFDVACSHIVIDPTPPIGQDVVSCQVETASCGNGLNGNFSADDFFCNVSAGPYEEGQALSFSIDGSISGDSNIIDTSFLGGITANSNLSDLLIFTNDGETGTATFKLIATDDDSENPLSSIPSSDISIEVRPESYTIGGMVENPFPASGEITVSLYNNQSEDCGLPNFSNRIGRADEDDIDTGNNNVFTFVDSANQSEILRIESGQNYKVCATSPNLSCSVTNDSGIVGSSNINNITVSCE